MSVIAVAEYPEMSPQMVKIPTPLQVLVVDDESLIRWSLAEVLADSGCLVDEAGDGASALNLLARRPAVRRRAARFPASRLERPAACSRRSATMSPGSAVIMMTAFGTPEMVEGALRLGAYRVVPKPFDLQDMVRLVAEATRPPMVYR